MAIAKITNHGLVTTAALVVVLWSCVVGEHMIVRRADVAGRRAMADLQMLRLKRGKAASTTSTKPAARRGLAAGRC